MNTHEALEEAFDALCNWKPFSPAIQIIDDILAHKKCVEVRDGRLTSLIDMKLDKS